MEHRDQPASIHHYVYRYQFLDDLAFIRSPHEVSEEWARTSPFWEATNVDESIESVRQTLLAAGWDGDGTMGLLWLPPFVDVGVEDTQGTYIWHVKQRNNGISWLLSPVELKFQRLETQNPWEEAMQKRGWVPVSILDTEVTNFLEDLDRQREGLAQELQLLASAPSSEAKDALCSDLIAFHQGKLISLLGGFVEHSYLQLLQEVILRGNPYGVKLRRFAVRLDPSAYTLPDAVPGEKTPEILTLAGVVSDAWRDFRFQPFREKLDALTSSVDFRIEPPLRHEILKHVEIRNCMQHHDEKLTSDALERLGVFEISIRVAESAAPVVLKAWDRIILTEAEFSSLSRVLRKLALQFKAYFDSRVGSRAFQRPDKEGSAR